MKKLIIEGEVGDITSEDAGWGLTADVWSDDDHPIHVQLISYLQSDDDFNDHKELRELVEIGKLRVTIEQI